MDLAQVLVEIDLERDLRTARFGQRGCVGTKALVQQCRQKSGRGGRKIAKLAAVATQNRDAGWVIGPLRAPL